MNTTASFTYYMLALTRIEGVGTITARRLLRHFKNPEAVFNASRAELSSIEHIGKLTARKISDFSRFDLVDKELNFTAKNNIETLTLFDEAYPKLLKQCPDAPVVLFKRGMADLHLQNSISIVGTRKITAQGHTFIKKLLPAITDYLPAVVSGYAFGVDICAHLAAIENRLPTIAVLGHGFNTTYPARHRKYNTLIEENGCFLTEFWSSDTVERENFVRRNRIVAGISQATLVVESALKGGSLLTAQMANDYHREVFAVPGRVSDPYSEGCHHLIKTHQAHLLTKAEDLAFMLNWEQPDNPKKSLQPELFLSLSPEEQAVHDYLKEKTQEVLDIIAIDLQIPVHRVSVLLLNLELKGLVKPLPGKHYQYMA